MFGNTNKKRKSEIQEEIKRIKREIRDLERKAVRHKEAYVASVSEKWDYTQVVNLKPDTLQTYGDLGWELVSITSYLVTTQSITRFNVEQFDSVNILYVFKRKRPQVPQEVYDSIDKKFGHAINLRSKKIRDLTMEFDILCN